MKACDVCHCFRQLKLRSCSKISWYVLVPVILKVDVWVPLEIQVDVSATFVLNICCFCTSRTTSWGEGGFSTSRNTSGCFSTSSIEKDFSVPLYFKLMFHDLYVYKWMFQYLWYKTDVLAPLVNVSVPLEQQLDVSTHNAIYH